MMRCVIVTAFSSTRLLLRTVKVAQSPDKTAVFVRSFSRTGSYQTKLKTSSNNTPNQNWVTDTGKNPGRTRKMPGTFSAVTHVLFDLDGLLIDSERFYEKIIGDIASQYGKSYTREIRAKILGTPEQITSQLAVDLMELPLTPDEFCKRMRKGVEAELQDPPLLPGAEKLIRHLNKHKIPFALATSGSQEATEIKLQNARELFDLFYHKVMGSTDTEVKKGKPHPDIFLVCASRFPNPPEPSKCLVFEDAPNGVKAGKAAGMQVVMVPSAEITEELKEGATIVLYSLEEFQPELFGLPKYD